MTTYLAAAGKTVDINVFDVSSPFTATEEKKSRVAVEKNTQAQNCVSCLHVRPEKQQIIAGSWDKAFYVYSYAPQENTTAASTESSTTTAAATSPSAPKILKIKNIVRDAHSEELLSITSFKKSDLIATGSVDGNIRIWNLNEKKKNNRLKSTITNGNGVWSMAATDSLASPYIFTGSNDHYVRMFDINTQKLVHVFTLYDMVRALYVDEARGLLYTGSHDKLIAVWDIKSPSTKPIGAVMGHEGAVMTFTPSADGKKLYSGGMDGSFNIWDISQVGPVLTKEVQKAHESTCTSIALSNDANIIYTGSADQTIKVWDTTNTDAPKEVISNGEIVLSLASFTL